MRRVKNIGYDDDDWGDDWGGGYSAAPKKNKPKAKSAAPKGAAKATAKSSAAPDAAPAKSKPAVKTSTLEELKLALKPADLSDSAVEKALIEHGSAVEDAFLALLAQAVESGSWVKSEPVVQEPAKEPQAENEEKSYPKKKAKEEKETNKCSEEKTMKEERADKCEKPNKSAAQVSGAPASAEVEAEQVSETAPTASVATDQRPCISLVVIGHVDAGKSTLMGHLLCLVGEVSSKQLHKFEKESKQIGKASFAYAWVLDEGDDERERGVTIDVCVKHFSTKSRRFTILDAPGHRDFVPNMVQGAVQADVALLVTDVSHFEAGFERGGQTKEHLQLVRALGISHVVIAINKLDTVDWSQDVYENIKSRVEAFVLGPDCGFKASSLTFVPLSGFTGENMLERKAEQLSWWNGPTLIEALDKIPLPVRPASSGPLRIPIADVYKSGANVVVSGKVESGSLSVGQKVLVLPSNEQAPVKSLQSGNQVVRSASVGDYLDSVIIALEPQFASIGGALCDPKHPLAVVDAFQAQILVFDVDVPIMRGQQFMCYLHVEALTATVAKLEKLIVKGKPQEKRPKCLQKGNIAIVQLRVNRKVCVEPKPKDGVPTSFGRLVLRDRGSTVAAGVVLAAATA